MCNLVNIGASGFADRGECVDRRYTLCKHRIGGKFGELGRPEANGEDAIGTVEYSSRRNEHLFITWEEER